MKTKVTLSKGPDIEGLKEVLRCVKIATDFNTGQFMYCGLGQFSKRNPTDKLKTHIECPHVTLGGCRLKGATPSELAAKRFRIPHTDAFRAFITCFNTHTKDEYAKALSEYIKKVSKK